jgi:hypothetical protein
MFAAEEIKNRARQQPFIPFRIVTSAGESYEITHQDLVWVGSRELHVGFAHPTKPTLYNGTARLALMHVTALVDLPIPASGPGKNGPVAS